MNANKIQNKLEEKVFSLLENIDESTSPWGPAVTAQAISTLLNEYQRLQEILNLQG